MTRRGQVYVEKQKRQKERTIKEEKKTKNRRGQR